MKPKDFTLDIAQVKEDMIKMEGEIEKTEAILIEKKKHLETLKYFLETIEQ